MLFCIDQGNIRERNHQVRQMARVYRTAKRLLIWPVSIPLNLVDNLLMDVAFSRSNVRPIIRGICIKIFKESDICIELTLKVGLG